MWNLEALQGIVIVMSPPPEHYTYPFLFCILRKVLLQSHSLYYFSFYQLQIYYLPFNSRSLWLVTMCVYCSGPGLHCSFFYVLLVVLIGSVTSFDLNKILFRTKR